LVAAAAPPSLIDIDRRGKARFVVDVGLTIVVVVHKTSAAGRLSGAFNAKPQDVRKAKHEQLN
jgi:hypothetical protein